MSKIGIFMADGCEEIEGLTVVDIVRRAKMDITMISVNGKREVTSSHGVTFLADAVAEEVDYDALDGIVLPGDKSFMKIFGRETNDYIVKWKYVKTVGEDVILVDVPPVMD